MTTRRSTSNRAKRSRRTRQLDLPMHTWGGSRPGAGRKPAPGRRRVEHRTRIRPHRTHPVHVTMRIVDGVPSLRSRRAWETIVRAMRAARGRFGLDVVHYCVLGNHIHLLVETRDRASLEHGMRGLSTRLAKRLNRTFERRGRLLSDRYHARALATPLEVRRGLAYVIQNYRKHAQHRKALRASWIDPRSTGATLDGWRGTPRSPFANADFGTVAARTWLLAIGWRRHGLLITNEIPSTGPPHR